MPAGKDGPLGISEFPVRLNMHKEYVLESSSLQLSPTFPEKASIALAGNKHTLFKHTLQWGIIGKLIFIT